MHKPPVEKKKRFLLHFEFQTEEGKTGRHCVKTHDPKRLEDESLEPLLYDPANPSFAMALDELPGTARLDADGNVSVKDPALGALSAFLPGLTILLALGLLAY